MRRILFLTVVLVFALPVAAAWPAHLAPGDGTLVVDNGRGVVVVSAKGGIIGRFDQGNVVIEDLNLTDGRTPTVINYDLAVDLGNGRTRYIGTNLRFRMIGGLFRARINAVGIDVSAVGRGSVVLDASGYTDFPGHFSINGGSYQPLPGHLTTYTLGQAPPGQLGK